MIWRGSKNIGNISRRQVSFEEGKQWMEEKGLNLFFETSAKNNQNVELVSN